MSRKWYGVLPLLIAFTFSLPTFADSYNLTFTELAGNTATMTSLTTAGFLTPATGTPTELEIVWNGLTFTWSATDFTSQDLTDLETPGQNGRWCSYVATQPARPLRHHYRLPARPFLRICLR